MYNKILKMFLFDCKKNFEWGRLSAVHPRNM